MGKIRISAKQIQINKANTTIMIAVSVAAFVVTFSLIASRALLNQRSYQSKVIHEKEAAVHQLKENLEAADSLINSYKQFVSTPQNVLGGSPAGNGDRDGDSAKLVLDALPSKYDFPAVATSLEKILTSANYSVDSIGGTDDELAQQQNDAPTPQPVEIPFQAGVSGTYESIHTLLATLEKSIRPIEVRQLTFSGNNAELKLLLNARTYYQPEKNLNITKKVVK